MIYLYWSYCGGASQDIFFTDGERCNHSCSPTIGFYMILLISSNFRVTYFCMVCGYRTTSRFWCKTCASSIFIPVLLPMQLLCKTKPAAFLFHYTHLNASVNWKAFFLSTVTDYSRYLGEQCGGLAVQAANRRGLKTGLDPVYSCFKNCYKVYLCQSC